MAIRPPYVDSLADMLAHRVPVVAQTGGDGGFPMADRFVAAGLVTRYEEYSRGVQLLQLHRGDVMIGDRWAVAYAANLQHVALRCLALDITHDEVAYMLSRKTLNTADLNAINQAIGRLTANGTLDRIRHRWLASERPGASQQANSLTP
jgi:ABC-type amino acid transport substrate-binding protein